MSIVLRRWGLRTFALLLFTMTTACLVSGRGYVGGVYDPPGYVYGSWGPGYRVGPPPHGGGRRPQQSPPRAYRPAPQTRLAPSIPTRKHKH
jgi:hypothetical protein